MLPNETEKLGSFWWISQIFYFLLQPNIETKNHIEKIRKDINFLHPIVTIHVRHGDKGYEANLYPLSIYMNIMKKKFPTVIFYI